MAAARQLSLAGRVACWLERALFYPFHVGRRNNLHLTDASCISLGCYISRMVYKSFLVICTSLFPCLSTVWLVNLAQQESKMYSARSL